MPRKSDRKQLSTTVTQEQFNQFIKTAQQAGHSHSEALRISAAWYVNANGGSWEDNLAGRGEYNRTATLEKICHRPERDPYNNGFTFAVLIIVPDGRRVIYSAEEQEVGATDSDYYHKRNLRLRFNFEGGEYPTEAAIKSWWDKTGRTLCDTIIDGHDTTEHNGNIVGTLTDEAYAAIEAIEDAEFDEYNNYMMLNIGDMLDVLADDIDWTKSEDALIAELEPILEKGAIEEHYIYEDNLEDYIEWQKELLADEDD